MGIQVEGFWLLALQKGSSLGCHPLADQVPESPCGEVAWAGATTGGFGLPCIATPVLCALRSAGNSSEAIVPAERPTAALHTPQTAP